MPFAFLCLQPPMPNRWCPYVSLCQCPPWQSLHFFVLRLLSLSLFAETGSFIALPLYSPLRSAGTNHRNMSSELHHDDFRPVEANDDFRIILQFGVSRKCASCIGIDCKRPVLRMERAKCCQVLLMLSELASILAGDLVHLTDFGSYASSLSKS